MFLSTRLNGSFKKTKRPYYKTGVPSKLVVSGKSARLLGDNGMLLHVKRTYCFCDVNV